MRGRGGRGGGRGHRGGGGRHWHGHGPGFGSAWWYGGAALPWGYGAYPYPPVVAVPMEPTVETRIFRIRKGRVVEELLEDDLAGFGLELDDLDSVSVGGLGDDDLDDIEDEFADSQDEIIEVVVRGSSSVRGFPPEERSQMSGRRGPTTFRQRLMARNLPPGTRLPRSTHGDYPPELCLLG